MSNIIKSHMNAIITENAWTRITEVLARDSKNVAVKLSVINGGCSGKKYKFTLIDKINDEYVFTNNNSTFVIAKDIAQELQNIIVDFHHGIIGSSFSITNPQAKKSCRCGISFNV